MRLWTLHPKYLDPQGLVALWREGLLARKVLRGETRGYRHHPQLERFKFHVAPLLAIDAYLAIVYVEAAERGYRFDRGKITPVCEVGLIPATSGQVAYEWQHLLHKLSSRSPAFYECWQALSVPEAHPLFRLCNGGIESWERAALHG